MIDARTLPLGHPIYTFVDKAGVNTHIDSGALREWCHANEGDPSLLKGMAPVDEALAHEFIHNNTVSVIRVLELLARDDLDPIILCKDGEVSPVNGSPNVMLVDGHHRFVLAAKLRMKTIPAFLVELHQWQPFQVTNMIDLTEEQLRSIPIRKRNY